MVSGKYPSRQTTKIQTLLCLLLGFATGLGCSPRPAAPPPTPASSLSRIPHLGLGPTDDIDAVDFEVDRDGVLHVAWRAVLQKPSSSGAVYKVLYAQGAGGGAAWTTPVEIEGRRGKPPRVALTPGRIHVLQEQDLRHFISGDGGRSWQEAASPLPAGGGRVVGLDVLSHGESLLIAHLVRLSEPGGGGLELRVARWPAEEPPRRVATFPGSTFQQPDPRLVAEGGRLHLLCGINSENRRTVSSGGRTAEEFQVSGRLVHTRSEDAGATWSEPVDVVPDGTVPAGIKPLEAVELLPLRGRLHALFSAFGLYASRLEEGRPWSAPVPVAPYAVSASEGTYESGSVSAAAAGGRGYVAWIDARFRKSDRSWRNPLGGAPWSDDSPFWTNNDVFLLPLAELEALSGSRPGRHEQVTPPGSFTRGLRVRAGGPDRFFLLWTGRKQGKKNLAASGQEPEIVFTTVP